VIRHHPTDATLLACAGRTLPDAHTQVVAAHLALCPRCRETLRFGEAIGGAVLESLPPAPMAEDALARTLARLDQAGEDSTTSPDDASPGAISSLPPVSDPAEVLAALARGRWRRLAPGIRLMRLAPRDASGTRLDLIRVAPGTALPEHGHSGFEMTCVLRGAFAEDGQSYYPGDLAEADVSSDHRLVALPGEDCICLTSTTGLIRPRGLLARLVQPWTGL
jgi:putative transcriptional regulator